MGENLVVTGMVLNAMPIGEYDKRITILTRERGKITAFARGARKPTSQLLAATGPFSFGEFELYEGRSSYTVSKAVIRNYFRELAMDLEAAYYGFYFLEMADYYCQENSDEVAMLKLVYQSLRALESTAFDNRLVRAVFELKTYAINGEAPNVFRCTHCGGTDRLSWFSPQTAGMVCEDCGVKHGRELLYGYRKLTESTVYTMQYVISSPVEKLYNFSVSDQVLKELSKLLSDYAGYHVGHAFKSLKILEETVSGKN